MSIARPFYRLESEGKKVEGTRYLTKESVLKRGQEIIGIPMREEETGTINFRFLTAG